MQEPGARADRARSRGCACGSLRAGGLRLHCARGWWRPGPAAEERSCLWLRNDGRGGAGMAETWLERWLSQSVGLASSRSIES